jgi:hypothetical protein
MHLLLRILLLQDGGEEDNNDEDDEDKDQPDGLPNPEDAPVTTETNTSGKNEGSKEDKVMRRIMMKQTGQMY